MGQSRRTRLAGLLPALLAVVALPGCSSLQLVRFDSGDAAAEALYHADEAAFGPVVEDAVASLLARHVPAPMLQASFDEKDLVPPPPKRICVVTDDGSDETGVLEPIRAILERRITASSMFAPADHALVATTLRESGIEPTALVVPENRKTFATTLAERGEPIDYLLFVTLTSDPEMPPRSGGPAFLTLELIDAASGSYDQQPIDVSKILRARPWWGRR